LRNIIVIIIVIGITACSDWLTILPQNTQPADKFWNSKEDIVSVLGAGYYKLRECSEKLIAWGEVRASAIYPRNTYTEMQEFRIRTNSEAIVSWGPLYQVINMANSVLQYAPDVFDRDETLDLPTLNSYLTEAYFLRALSYFYLVRNWRDVPLILEPYVTDEYGYEIPKSSDTLVMAQIKEDIRTALNMGAAREYFDQAWETKGRSTKWALYALMADACLWTEDYSEAITYCDSILNATVSNRPVFI
ncbi:MAG: RagB/SusD family nutrient uptake outer membrane protein, partial [Odoribacter sp.]|nr:RagB/SusD family nutrient uptake outer membrane protein [Odoribacter sp.]